MEMEKKIGTKIFISSEVQFWGYYICFDIYLLLILWDSFSADTLTIIEYFYIVGLVLK